MSISTYSTSNKTEHHPASKSWLSSLGHYWFFILIVIAITIGEYYLRFNNATILLKMPFFAVAFYLVLAHLTIQLWQGDLCPTRSRQIKILYSIIAIYFVGLIVIEYLAHQRRNFFYLLYLLPLANLLLLRFEPAVEQQSDYDHKIRNSFRIMQLVSLGLALLFYVMLVIFNGTNGLFNLWIYNPVQQLVLGVALAIWLSSSAQLRLPNYLLMLSYHWLLALVLYVASVIGLIYFNQNLIGDDDLPFIIFLIAAVLMIAGNAIFLTYKLQNKGLPNFMVEMIAVKGSIFAILLVLITLFIS